MDEIDAHPASMTHPIIGSRTLQPALSRTLTVGYLGICSSMVRWMIDGRSGPRNFERVVVVGPLARRNGVAQGAHLQWAALRRVGVDAELIDAARALRNPLFRIAHRPGSAYVIHAGAPQAANLLAAVLPAAAQCYRVAYFAWELPDPPPDWAGCERHFDEIWTPSTHSQRSLARLFNRPIHVVPHHLPAQPLRERDPNRPFTVLTMADSRSSFSRKNPQGALLAFHKAFGHSPRARLILKLGGRQSEIDGFRTAHDHLLNGRNIQILVDHLQEAALVRLLRSADVLVSLHRAEGFGLPMLEAMANGIPVVATGWSGNLDYMGPIDSALIPYRLVPVDDPSCVYSGSVWAEPEIDAAAAALRRLADDHAHYQRIALAAHRRVQQTAPRFPFDHACGNSPRLCHEPA